jgi:hypothetical protein
MAHLLDPTSPECIKLFSLLTEEELEALFPFPTPLDSPAGESDCACAFCLLLREEDGLDPLHAQTLGYLMRLIEYIHVMGDKLKVMGRDGRVVSLRSHLEALPVGPRSTHSAMGAVLDCIERNMDLIDAIWEDDDTP